MNNLELRSILEQYVAAMNAHDIERVLGFFTDDCVCEDVGIAVTCHGKSELRDFFAANFSAVPDMKLDLKSSFVSGDSACTEWVLSGTHMADFPGMPATGKPFSICMASVMNLGGGRILQNTDYADVAGLLRQLGLPIPQ